MTIQLDNIKTEEEYNYEILFNVQCKNIEALKSLLSIDNFELTYKYTEAINYCAKIKDSTEIFELLINNKNLEKSYSNYDLIKSTTKERNLKLLKLLINDVRFYNFKTLQNIFDIAIFNKYSDIIIFFLTQKNILKDIHLGVLFDMIIEKQLDDVFYFMLQHTKLNPATFQNSPIQKAFKIKRYDLVEVLWTYPVVKKTLNKNTDVYQYIMVKENQKKIKNF